MIEFNDVIYLFQLDKVSLVNKQFAKFMVYLWRQTNESILLIGLFWHIEPRI